MAKIVTGSGKTVQSYEEWKNQPSGSSGGSNKQVVTASGKAVQSYDDWKVTQTRQRNRAGYVNSFIRDANDFFASARQDRENGVYLTAAEAYAKRKEQADSLKRRGAIVSKYMDDNRKLYSAEDYGSVKDFLASFDTDVDDVMGFYDQGARARTGMEAYQDEMLAYQEAQKNSQLPLAIQAGMMPEITNPAYGFINAQNQYRSDNSYREINDQWTEEERYTLGLQQQEDPAKAKEYAMAVNQAINDSKTAEQRQNIRDMATKSGWAGALHTAGALGSSLAFGMAEFADRAAQYSARGEVMNRDVLTPWDYSREVVGGITDALNEKYQIHWKNPARVDLPAAQQAWNMPEITNPAYLFASLQNEHAGEVSEPGGIPEWVPIVGGKGVGDLYNMGYSMAQNLLARNTLGRIGGTLTLGRIEVQPLMMASYFASAAVSGIDEARQKGSTSEQAVASGIAKGTWEVATEVFGLDNLFKMGPAVTWGDLFKQMGMQGLFEAFGEATNEALSILSDKFILGDLSDYELSVQEYMKQGMDEESARFQAFMDATENVAFAGMSGAVSGMVSGGAEVGLKTGLANQYYRSNVSPEGLIDAGMETAEGGKAYQMAQELQRRLDAGENISGNDKRMLDHYIGLAEQEQARTAATEKAAADLAALGETGDVQALAAIVAKRAMGEELTRSEKNTLRRSGNAQQLIEAMENSRTENQRLHHGHSLRSPNQPADWFAMTEENGSQGGVSEARVSRDGRAIQISTEKNVDVLDFASIQNGKATIQLKDGGTAAYSDISFATEAEANRFRVVADLPGIETEAANDLFHTLEEHSAGEDIDSMVAVRDAYMLGYQGTQERTLDEKGREAAYLTPELRKAVYDIGAAQRKADAMAVPATRAAQTKPSKDYKKVVIEGKDANVKLTGKQEAEVRFMDYIAENFSGTTVHVFRSYKGRDGKFYYRDSNGQRHRAPNGKYHNDEIWVDLNAGDKGEGLVLNTFAHEMYHHVKKWSPQKANELGEFIVKELGMESVEAAVAEQIQKARKAGLSETYYVNVEGLTREQARNRVEQNAWEDFIADSLETMFTRGDAAKAIANLKSENRSLFDKIKGFIDEWVGKLKKFYSDKTISKEGDMVAQLERFEQIQKLFMEAMDDAGKNFSAAEVANEKNTTLEGDVKYQARRLTEEDLPAYLRAGSRANKNKLSALEKGQQIILTSAQQIRQFISSAIDKTLNNNTTVAYGKVNDRLANDVLAASKGKIKIKDNYLELIPEHLQHAYEHHHIAKQTGDIDLTREDFENIPEYLDSYTEIVYAIEYASGKVGVCVSKRLPNGRILLIETVSKSRGALQFKNAIGVSESKYQTDYIDVYKKRAGTNTRGSDSSNNSLRDDPSSKLSIRNSEPEVNPEKNFLRNEDAVDNSPRGILMRLDAATRNKAERDHLGRYQERVEKLAEQEARLKDVNAKIEELSSDKVKNKAAIRELQSEARNAQLHINMYNRKLRDAEKTDMFRKMVSDGRLMEYRAEQRETEKARIEEYRALRKELTGADSVMSVMEDEFVRLARDYEAQKIDLKTMEAEFLRLSKEYDSQVKDNRTWEREFKRLMQQYERMETKNANAKSKITALEADIERRRQAAKEKVQNRQTKELRIQIRKDIRALDRLLNAGTKKQNVKQGMRDFVAEAIRSAEILFTDIYSDEAIIRQGAKSYMSPETQDLITKAQAVVEKLDSLPYGSFEAVMERDRVEPGLKRELAGYKVKLKSVLVEERARYNNTRVADVLTDLSDAYKSLRDSEYGYIKAAYNEAVSGYFDTLRENVQGTVIKDMSKSQLQDLHRAYTMVLHTVRNANRGFVLGRFIAGTGDQVIRELDSRKKPNGKTMTALHKLANKVGWDYEKLSYALERIGCETVTKLFTNLADSENTVMRDVAEAAKFRDKMVEKYHYNDWKVDQQIDRDFVAENGRTFRLTLGELMALYAYSRRENAQDNLTFGGFQIGEERLTDPRPADTYRLTPEQTKAITGALTQEQKGFVEEMQKYLSETMGVKGNEVSMQLYGVEMYTEKNYFPVQIAGNFQQQVNEAEAKERAGFGTLAGAGFTHEKNAKAKEAFVLDAFMSTWAHHVNEMSRYHGSVLALEDIRRVMNYRAYTENGDPITVRQAIENSAGKEAVRYLEELYREANSGAVNDRLEAKSKRMIGKFRKNAVAYSLSVLFQQQGALYRAAALIPQKYFGAKGFAPLIIGNAKALASRWHPAYGNAYEEMRKYAPGVTMAKEIGGFDTASGNSIYSYLTDTNKSLKQIALTEPWQKKGKVVMQAVDNNWIANLPNVADKIAWIEIWNACKREIRATKPDLTPGSEAYMQAVGKRFTQVIRDTQVYDSIFAKSPMLRSKNVMVQSLVSFMNEPNTVANMVESGIRDLTTKGKRGTGIRKLMAVAASTLVTNAMAALIYAARDEDEDEALIEKYLEHLIDGLADDVNPLNYVPVVKDVWSMSQGYEVTRPDMDLINQVFDAVRDIRDINEKIAEEHNEENLLALDKKMTKANWKMVGAVGGLLGIPVKNVYRDIMAMLNLKDAIQVEGVTWGSLEESITEALKREWLFTAEEPEDTTGDKLYAALVRGDTEYAQRLEGTFADEKERNKAVRDAIRKTFEAGEMDKKEARNHLMEYTGATVIEAHDFAREWEYYKEDTTGKEYKKYDALYQALESGENLDSVVKEYTDGGTDEETLRRQITTTYKDKYVKEMSDEERSAIKPKIEAAYLACGGQKWHLEDTFQEWDYEVAHGVSYDDQVEAYKDKAMTESEFIDIMVGDRGLSQEDAQRNVRELEFADKYQFSYDDKRTAYLRGMISRRDLKTALMTVGGMSADEAEEELKSYDFEKTNKWAYEDKKQLYLHKGITRAQLRTALIGYGGYEPEDADLQIEAYDWEDDGYQNVTPARVRKYHEYCEEAKVPKDAYLSICVFAGKTENDIDPETGKTIQYTAVQKIMAEIDKLNLTDTQKTAIAESMGWKQSTISKYKLW